ncbi:MAG: PD-(D/E)XK nuclease family protein [Clostridia bacterium]|nr:PD-(D/E)XK nuclease family protein [Clostridia bacterium]
MEINVFASNTTAMAINSAIDALGRRNTADSSHIVIVPDRFTLSTEKDIYDRLELDGSFNIDVVSFSRLAVKVQKSVGHFLTKEGTVMLMKKVIGENKEKLLYFRNYNSMGFAREIFAVTASFRSSGISASDLSRIAEGFESHKKSKYLDLALLYAEYESALKSRFIDTVTRQNQLIEAIKTDERVAQSHIFVLGFNIYSELQLAVIKELSFYAKSMNIASATESGGYNNDIFPTAQLEELREYALANKINYNKSYYFERLTPPLDTVHKEIFSLSKNRPLADGQESIRLMRPKNPYEEIKAVAREIVYRVRQGARFRDIAVVCCQDTYKVCIKEIFQRFGIPFFIDEKYGAIHSASAKYLCGLIEAVLYGLRRDKVLNFIKHPLFSKDARGAERFENYCLKYNINYTRFRSPFLLGEGESFEALRAEFVALSDAVKTKGTAAEIADSLSAVFPDEQEGGELLFRASSEAGGKIKELLAEIKTILGDEEMSLEDFYAVLADGIAGLEIALIPQYADCVFVGSTSESRFSSIKYIFAVGASEGFFPRKTAEQTIISFADMLMLERSGLSVRPHPLESNRLEQFVVADLLAKAEIIYVSCSSYGLSGEQMTTGEAVKELSYILQRRLATDYAPAELDDEAKLLYRLASPDNAFYEFISGNVPQEYTQCVRKYLTDSGFGDRIQFFEQQQAPENFAEYVFYKDNDGYITKVSQLESYFCCPHMHYLRYGLGLQEKQLPELQVTDVGNIIHKVLEIYFAKNLKELKTLSDEQVEQKSGAIIAAVLDDEKLRCLREDSIGKYTVKLIYSECMYVIKKLTENIRSSSFEPAYIELAFGDGKQFKAIVLDTPEGKIKLRGKIDRVDCCGNKVAIIDYKTGSSVSGKYQDIYFGKKIQLYVYLSVFLEKGFEPAGVFYLPIRDSYRKDGESFAYMGQVEDSAETLAQLDNRLSDEGGESGIIKVTVKNGAITTRSKNIISRADFRNICAYVNRLIVNAVGEITGGNIDRSPISKTCNYCAYKNHCDMTDVVSRAVTAMDVKDFLEEQ